ncbi:MAG: hypothetical protein QG615_1644 [Nitrospirota bacterium]|nr:hypothetical protein [Nitrospirota bacterium]
MARATNHTYTGNKIAEDFHNTVYDISPTDTPFLTMAKRFKATSTLHNWTYDVLTAAAANQQVEGDDFDPTARAQPTTLNNYTQILRKDVNISGTFEAVNKYGRKSEVAYQTARMSKELKRDLEYALVRNQGGDAGTAASARVMGSMESWISSTAPGNAYRASGSTGGTSSGYAGGVAKAPTDGTATAMVEADLKGALALAWADGGDPSVIMMSSANKQIFSGFTGIATRFNDVKGATSANIIGSADVYVSNFGVHKAVLNRYMRDQAVLCIDPDYVGVAFLRPFQRIDIAKTGDGEKKAILCEATLVVQNPLAHAKIYNCG